MPFADRTEAGKKLAAALSEYAGEEAVVFALPRGGVPVAAEIAHALHAPLDVIVVRKVGVPGQPELAMGAVVDGTEPVTVRNEDVIGMVGISEEAFQSAVRLEMKEVERRRLKYVGGRPFTGVKGKVAIVVDDGVATGATMRAALRALRRFGPAQIVLAVPVGPVRTLEQMRGEADEVVCLEEYEDFGAISVFYRNFNQTSDEEVIGLLERFRTCG